MTGSRRRFAIGTVLLVCLTIVAYSPALRGPQLLDDRYAIQDNPSITNLWSITGPLHPPPGTPVSGRPVVNYSLAFNYWINEIFGVDQRPDPNGTAKTVSYHVANLVLHICCGLLLLGIVRRTLRGGRVGERWKERADGVALLVAALWMLHPLQTDAVDYLIQRTELIVSLCYLATLYCSIRAWDAAAPARWLWAGVVASAIGMASKEVMVSAPLMIVLYDRAFRFNSWRELAGRENHRRWFYAALAATLLVLLAIMLGKPRGGTAGFNLGLPWYEYLHTQGWAIAHYLRLVFLPTALSIAYDVHPVAHWRGVPGLALLAALGTITIVAWTRADRWGWLGFLGAWFFLILAPSSSIVPILDELVAERRMYLPLAAVIILLVVALEAAVRDTRRGAASSTSNSVPGFAVALGGAAVLLLAAGTFRRSILYGDAEAMWRDAIVKVPENSRAWNNLGVVLASLPVPRPQAAESLYARTVALDSSYVNGLLNLALSELGHHSNASAERHFRRVLVLDSTNLFAVGGLSMVILGRGDTTAALPFMERYAAAGAGARAYLSLGQVYLARGRVADADAAFRRAVAEDLTHTDLMVFIGGTLVDQKHAELGEPYLEEAVRRTPGSAVNLAILSLAHADLGHVDEAVQDAQRAVQGAGQDAHAWYYAGRAMRDARRRDLAESYLARAMELGPRDPTVIAELGEVKADMGKKAEAIALFDRALQIDPANAAAQAGRARLR